MYQTLLMFNLPVAPLKHLYLRESIPQGLTQKN